MPAIYAYAYVHICIYTYIFICMSVYLYTHVSIPLCTWVSICICIVKNICREGGRDGELKCTRVFSCSLLDSDRPGVVGCQLQAHERVQSRGHGVCSGQCDMVDFKSEYIFCNSLYIYMYTYIFMYGYIYTHTLLYMNIIYIYTCINTEHYSLATSTRQVGRTTQDQPAARSASISGLTRAQTNKPTHTHTCTHVFRVGTLKILPTLLPEPVQTFCTCTRSPKACPSHAAGFRPA